MGVADLRDAFNTVVEPAGFTCSKALLGYEPGDNVQFQRLTFSGTDRDGKAFTIKSDRIRPDGDVLEGARLTANRLLDLNKPPLAEGPAS